MLFGDSSDTEDENDANAQNKQLVTDVRWIPEGHEWGFAWEVWIITKIYEN